MIFCVKAFETKNGNVSLTWPILKVISHSPWLSISDPLAGLILIWLPKSSVLNLSGILWYWSKEITQWTCSWISQGFMISITYLYVKTTIFYKAFANMYNFLGSLCAKVVLLSLWLLVSILFLVISVFLVIVPPNLSESLNWEGSIHFFEYSSIWEISSQSSSSAEESEQLEHESSSSISVAFVLA